jgi:hypothetical protein
VDWKDYPLQPWLTRLAELKKSKAQQEGEFVIVKAEPAIQAVWNHPEGSLYGIFNVTGSQGFISLHIPDGTYVDELTHKAVHVKQGKIMLLESALILRINQPLLLNPAYCELLDYGVPAG